MITTCTSQEQKTYTTLRIHRVYVYLYPPSSKPNQLRIRHLPIPAQKPIHLRPNLPPPLPAHNSQPHPKPPGILPLLIVITQNSNPALPPRPPKQAIHQTAIDQPKHHLVKTPPVLHPQDSDVAESAFHRLREDVRQRVHLAQVGDFAVGGVRALRLGRDERQRVQQQACVPEGVAVPVFV